jgi:hypothetical protein
MAVNLLSIDLIIKVKQKQNWLGLTDVMLFLFQCRSYIRVLTQVWNEEQLWRGATDNVSTHEFLQLYRAVLCPAML